MPNKPTRIFECRILRRRSVCIVLCGLLMTCGLCAPVDYAVARDKDRPRVTKKSRPADPEPEMLDEDSDIVPAGGNDNSGSEKKAAPKLTLNDAIAFAKESREALKEVKDYTAHFSKSERIGRDLVQQEMDMKFRTKPFSVYFSYQSNNERGRQALYVDGRNSNQLLVKEAKGIASVAGAVSLRLDDSRVKRENLYPVTHVGISNMLEVTIKEWEHDMGVAGDDVEIKFYPNAKMNGVPCQAVEVTHLKKLKEIRYSKNRIYFDKETKLPIRGERYGWPARAGDPAPLMEDYKYTNLKTNVNLTDNDFNRARYGF